MTELIIRVLRPIADQIRTDEIVSKETVQALQQAYDYRGEEDPYHVKLRTQDTYASMSDIATYLAATYPDLDLRSWSMSDIGQGRARVCVGDTQILLSKNVMDSLTKVHEHVAFYEDREQEWTIDLTREERDWIKKGLPGDGYVSRQEIKRLLAVRMSQLVRISRSQKIKETDWLAEQVESYTQSWGQRHDILNALCCANAYAKQKRLALYVTLDQ